MQTQSTRFISFVFIYFVLLLQDEKERDIVLIDESSRESRQRMSMDLQLQSPEFELEFWPVEHPLEPPDEDRPVKCPIPAPSSVLNVRSFFVYLVSFSLQFMKHLVHFAFLKYCTKVEPENDPLHENESNICTCI